MAHLVFDLPTSEAPSPAPPSDRTEPDVAEGATARRAPCRPGPLPTEPAATGHQGELARVSLTRIEGGDGGARNGLVKLSLAGGPRAARGEKGGVDPGGRWM